MHDALGADEEVAVGQSLSQLAFFSVDGPISLL
jgi:hypothetical protein